MWWKWSSFVVFDDILVYNQKTIDPFFTKGRHIDFDVYYLSQSLIDLQKRIVKYNSKVILLLKQSLKGVENRSKLC